MIIVLVYIVSIDLLTFKPYYENKINEKQPNKY